MLPQKNYTCRKTWKPSQEFSSPNFWNIASKTIFFQPLLCRRVVHYMLIVLQRHFFIKWDKRKVPGFKESYCYSSVLSYFACGKTRLRCKKLTLNNKYTKSYVITLKWFQLLTYVYSCWWEIPVWSKPTFPKSQNMLSYYVKCWYVFILAGN